MTGGKTITQKERDDAVHEARKALYCLFLAVDHPEIAEDVRTKVEAAFNALKGFSIDPMSKPSEGGAGPEPDNAPCLDCGHFHPGTSFCAAWRHDCKCRVYRPGQAEPPAGQAAGRRMVIGGKTPMRMLLEAQARAAAPPPEQARPERMGFSGHLMVIRDPEVKGGAPPATMEHTVACEENWKSHGPSLRLCICDEDPPATMELEAKGSEGSEAADHIRGVGGMVPSLRAVVGALQDTINTHGPITRQWVSSAAKRIIGGLSNVSETDEGAAKDLAEQIDGMQLRMNRYIPKKLLTNMLSAALRRAREEGQQEERSRAGELDAEAIDLSNRLQLAEARVEALEQALGDTADRLVRVMAGTHKYPWPKADAIIGLRQNLADIAGGLRAALSPPEPAQRREL
jgi:hypothetical protein